MLVAEDARDVLSECLDQSFLGDVKKVVRPLRNELSARVDREQEIAQCPFNRAETWWVPRA